MIVGYHAIFGTYGFWLPNDLRRSWSDFVGAWDLFRYGPATQTTATRSLAHVEHDRFQRQAAKSALKYPPVIFTGLQARAVARGFAQSVQRTHLPIRAGAILRDHIHLVTDKPGVPIEQLVIQLKGEATRQLEREGIHPLADWKRDGDRVPKCFARGQWAVYLDPPDMPRAIQYVQENPLKEGLKPQDWSFVTPYA